MMRAWLLVVLLQVLPAGAVIETYQFDNEQQRVRYHQFIEELRCPKCQNQNLAGSNSPIAEDLRRELHRLLDEGRSDQQIVDYMVSRYGDFILYRPRFNPETALLWLAPAIFLLLGCWLMVRVYRRQSTGAGDDAGVAVEEEQALSAEEQRRLDTLLAQTRSGDKDNSNA